MMESHQLEAFRRKPATNHRNILKICCKTEKIGTNMNYGLKSSKSGGSVVVFWSVIVLLLFLTVGNLVLTLSIIGVLHFGKGIYGMELIPDGDTVKFYGQTDLDRIYLKNVAQLSGFLNEPVSITGDDSAIFIRLHHRNGQLPHRLIADRTGLQFRGVNTFDVKDPLSGSNIFSTHRPHYNLPRGVDALLARSISASRIVSAIDQPLIVSSATADSRISIRGSEGIQVDTSAISLQAGHNIVLNSTQGMLTFSAGRGIYIDTGKIPIVQTEMGLRTGNVQYKLCVCMPEGVLFRIAIPRTHNAPKMVSCAHFTSQYDLCAVN